MLGSSRSIRVKVHLAFGKGLGPNAGYVASYLFLFLSLSILLFFEREANRAE